MCSNDDCIKLKCSGHASMQHAMYESHSLPDCGKQKTQLTRCYAGRHVINKLKKKISYDGTQFDFHVLNLLFWSGLFREHYK